MENGSVGKDQTSTIQPAPAPDLLNHINHHHEPDASPISQHSLPSYKPLPSPTPIYYTSPQKSYRDQDNHSLASQDSGIPTLEINHPEPILHGHPRLNHNSSPATLPLDQPADVNVLCKSSTFPLSGYDSVRLFSPAARLAPVMAMGAGGGTLNRSDDISVCSVSSLSTELSATLSVSNEDILDFMVTSDSSAIVTLETDDHAGPEYFSDVTLSSSPGDPGDLWSPMRRHPGSGVTRQEEDGGAKRLGPLASFFKR